MAIKSFGSVKVFLGKHILIYIDGYNFPLGKCERKFGILFYNKFFQVKKETIETIFCILSSKAKCFVAIVPCFTTSILRSVFDNGDSWMQTFRLLIKGIQNLSCIKKKKNMHVITRNEITTDKQQTHDIFNNINHWHDVF